MHPAEILEIRRQRESEAQQEVQRLETELTQARAYLLEAMNHTYAAEEALRKTGQDSSNYDRKR